MRGIDALDIDPGTPLPRHVHESPVPLLLSGYVAHWPAIAACGEAAASAEYLAQFASDRPLTVYVGGPEIEGRFFYNQECTGFNFRSGKATLQQVLAKLNEPERNDGIESIYVGSTPVDQWLPGFRERNDVVLPQNDALASFWLGNRTVVSAHFDFPDNLACVVAGRRRFTLFPPEQLANLYIGPIDRTPSGQAISMVDFAAPDFERFPRFRDALAHAQTAVLEPGDAIFIPSMWWHHVAASQSFNLLVNYWWCSTPSVMGAPSAVLNHAIMALRDLPERQRDAWKRLFDYYVFEPEATNFEHIPPPGRGVLGALDETMLRRMRADLLNRLNQ